MSGPGGSNVFGLGAIASHGPGRVFAVRNCANASLADRIHRDEQGEHWHWGRARDHLDLLAVRNDAFPTSLTRQVISIFAPAGRTLLRLPRVGVTVVARVDHDDPAPSGAWECSLSPLACGTCHSC